MASCSRCSIWKGRVYTRSATSIHWLPQKIPLCLWMPESYCTILRWMRWICHNPLFGHILISNLGWSWDGCQFPFQRIQRTQSLKWYLLASHFFKSFSAEKSDFEMFFCYFFFFSIADSANSAFHVDLGLSENRVMQNRIPSIFSPISPGKTVGRQVRP